MRSNPSEFDLAMPADLQSALALLANDAGRCVAIAGGTDLMVQFAAGALPTTKLVSIRGLSELRQIELLPAELMIGAGCTYTDVRNHDGIARDFPMLAQAAGWTGGIANQNRGTLGGNIVNASPAADSLPALLAYDAELILVSLRGERRVPYAAFHTGYKKTILAADELIRAISLPRKFAGYISYARKVGARNAQAIAKVCIAALARMDAGIVHDARIALGSVAPTPVRLTQTENLLHGKRLDPVLAALAARTAAAEVRPIDDIRSTARYRAAVAGNIVAEFLAQLAASTPANPEAAAAESAAPEEASPEPLSAKSASAKSASAKTGAGPSELLARWNQLPAPAAENEILPCCGARAWAHSMAARRPFADAAALCAAADDAWNALTPADWQEAAASHPRIGAAARDSSPATAAAWSAQEQSAASASGDDVKAQLAHGNREYEQRFGGTFIVCAAGKTGSEILSILRQRLRNTREQEIQETAGQLRQITQLRLRKWLTP